MAPASISMATTAGPAGKTRPVRRHVGRCLGRGPAQARGVGEQSGGGDLLVDGHVLDVPGPAFVAREVAWALRRGCCLAQLAMSSRRWRVTTWAREGSIDICTTIVCMAPPDSTVFLLACHARGARTAGPSQFLGILGAGSPSVRPLRLTCDRG